MSFARASTVEPIQVLSDQLRLLMRSSDLPFQMSAMVVDLPAGGFVPLHTHAKAEEGYFVLDGALTLTIGDQSRTLGRGDFDHLAPRTLHGYANAGTAPVRFLAWTVGGPIDRFFEAMREGVKEIPRHAGAMAEITVRFGVQMAHPAA